jgi:hypothetical protein
MRHLQGSCRALAGQGALARHSTRHKLGVRRAVCRAVCRAFYRTLARQYPAMSEGRYLSTADDTAFCLFYNRKLFRKSMDRSSGCNSFWRVKLRNLSSEILTVLTSIPYYRGPKGSNCQAHRTRIKEYRIRNLTTTISQKIPKNKTN